MFQRSLLTKDNSQNDRKLSKVDMGLTSRKCKRFLQFNNEKTIPF